MARNDDYRTNLRKDGRWVVKRSGTGRATSIHDTQKEAWKEARRLARGAGSEALLIGKDGKIRARNAYGDVT